MFDDKNCDDHKDWAMVVGSGRELVDLIFDVCVAARCPDDGDYIFLLVVIPAVYVSHHKRHNGFRSCGML